MSKRKKTEASEKNQERNIPKAKKTHKRKTQVAREGDLERAAEASDSSNTPSKVKVAEDVQECSPEKTEMENSATVLDPSSAEESKRASSERKVCAKSFVPPSQDVLESSEAECKVRNAPCDTAGKAFQSTAAPSESLELMDLLVTNKEDTSDQGILHCVETLDVKIKNQDRIINIINGDAAPGSIDSQLEEAPKPTDIPANLSEKQKIKSKKRVSFSLCTSDNKDAKSFKERELSTGSLDHVKRNPNEDASEGPTLQIEHGTKNGCAKLIPIIKPSKLDTCDLRPNEMNEILSKRHSDLQMDTDQRMDGKEKTVMCGESELVCVEGCLSSAEIIPQLDGEVVRSESGSENPGSEAQGSLLSRGKGSGTSALSSLDTMAQMSSPAKDPLSVDLEFLLDSQLQGVFESNGLEHPPYKPFSLDDPCTARGTKSVANNTRDEKTARICDPSREEDATDIVRGLIKELSSLNRLVMSTHRDLDSFKRLNFRRYRQLGKLLPHSMNTVTNTQCTVRKKKKMSLTNIASFNVCKDFLCSSNVFPAVTSKAVIMPDAEPDV